MYINLLKSGKEGKIVYVRLCESVRQGKKTKHRIVKNLGRLDALLAKDPQALEKLRAQYKDESDTKKLALAQQRFREVQSILSIQPDEKKQNRPFPNLLYGHYVLKKLWDDELCLKRKLEYTQKASKIKYDLNAAVSYLTFLKAMDPASVLHCFETKDRFLGDPARDLTLDALYSSYDVIKENKDELLAWTNNHLDQLYGKERSSIIFYDVTNAYFETAMTDAEKGYEEKDYPENLTQMAYEALAAGRLNTNCFDAAGNVIAENLPESFLDAVAEEKIQYLRMRGPSKEHRFDLPLVSIALVVDKNGIPIDFEVFAGNASEFKTMPKAIETMKRKYNVKNVIVVADRGLNSASNLQMLLDNGLGFLVAQKVTQFDAKTQKAMLDLEGYQPIEKDDPEVGRYKVIKNWPKVNKDTGEVIPVKLVLTYNEKRKLRDEAILEVWKQIVEKKISKGAKIGPRKTGWASLAKLSDKRDREILGIDEKALAKKKMLCGYAAMVYDETNEVKERRTNAKVKAPDLLPEEIAATYHQLNQIEDCFRVMKNNLGLRPMYVRNSNHIRGHVTVCVLALILLRVLQQKLKANGVHYSIGEICEALGGAKVMAMRLNAETVCYVLNEDCYNVRKGHKDKSTEELLELQRKGLLDRNVMADLMQAAGLTAVSRISTRAELARALGTRFATDQEAIPALRYEAL